MLLALAATAHAAEGTETSNAMLISYHVPPAKRIAFREQLEKEELPQLQKWKAQGLLKNFQMLFNRVADSENWDALLVLDFAGATGISQWQQMERKRPAGLSPEALAMTSAIHSTPVSMPRRAGTPGAANESVFVVIPYATLVSAGDYLKYADGYVLPQFDGWIQEGHLQRYSIYAANLPAGRPWSTMIVLEYKNEEALANRSAVVAKVRARLSENPQWKAISDSKTKVRDEKQVVIAEQSQAR